MQRIYTREDNFIQPLFVMFVTFKIVLIALTALICPNCPDFPDFSECLDGSSCLGCTELS